MIHINKHALVLINCFIFHHTNNKSTQLEYTTSWTVFRDIQWNIEDPLSKVKKYGKDGKLISAKDLLNVKVPVKKGDRLVILRYSVNKKEVPVLTVPIRGNTVRSVLKTLYDGLHKNIGAGNRGIKGTKRDYYFEPSQKYPFPSKNEVVYLKIAGYFDSFNRTKYVEKYEKGRLKPVELYGDHNNFEGIRRKGKYLYFLAGS